NVRPEVPKEMARDGVVLPPPRFDESVRTVGQQETPPTQQKVDFPPPPVGTAKNNSADGNVTQTTGNNTSKHSGSPHQLINTTQATVEYRIDQVGPSGVGKVEIYMTPDNGQTWRRLSEDTAKRSPATITLPGDGVFGIRMVVSNGNGFGGKAPA